jgi:predicted 3-demethylubiquinone-9 3-methyltransferase (glyoxalase superfamily)
MRKGATPIRQRIVPRLWLGSRAGEAARFYVSIFKKSRITGVFSPGNAGAITSGKAKGAEATVEFEIEGRRFLASGDGPAFTITPAISFHVGCRTAGELDRLYAALSPGRRELLTPAAGYPSNERSVWFTDHFGLSWQLSLGGAGQKISPALLFVRKRNGSAEEAMRFYVSVFNGSKVETVVHHEKGKGEKEGAVKFAAFSLGGERFIAMDSGLNHKFTFTPAVSFAVRCGSRDEAEYFRTRLGASPQARQSDCLQDKYGISWQLLPCDPHDG